MAPGSCTSRLVSCTKLIASYTKQAKHEQALHLFHTIHASPSLAPDPFVLSLSLKNCAALRHLRLGRSIHAHAAKAGLDANLFVACSLLDMYGKCGSISTAHQLFDEMPQRNTVIWNAMISLYSGSGNIAFALRLLQLMDSAPNASSYNSIIAGLAESGRKGCSSCALSFCRQMQVSGIKPNLITLLSLLPSLVCLAALNLIKEIHGFSIRNHIHPHPHLSSALVETYGRCGCLITARQLFDEMPERDVVTWSAMISAYAVHGSAPEALSVFQRMESAEVKPDGIAFLGILKACCHAGLVDDARRYFAMMRADYGIAPGNDHYACMVDVLARAGRLREAYDLIKGMPMAAGASAWGALLGACQKYGDVGLAEIAGKVLFEIEPDNAANFVLLSNVYARAGKFAEADRVRRQMGERGVKRVPGSSWIISHL